MFGAKKKIYTSFFFPFNKKEKRKTYLFLNCNNNLCLMEEHFVQGLFIFVVLEQSQAMRPSPN